MVYEVSLVLRGHGDSVPLLQTQACLGVAQGRRTTRASASSLCTELGSGPPREARTLVAILLVHKPPENYDSSSGGLVVRALCDRQVVHAASKAPHATRRKAGVQRVKEAS